MADTVKCDAFADLYSNLAYCAGSVSMPGLRARAYFIPKKHITTWPTLPLGAATSMDEVAVYNGNFTLAAEKYFKYFDLVDGENEPKCEQVGSFGSMHFQNTVTLVIPGTEEAATGLITMLNNEDVVVVIIQRNGKARVLGNDMFRTNVKPSQTLGKGTSDANTTTIEVSVEDVAAAPFYPGEIVIEAGVKISGADGKPIPVDPNPGDSGS